MSKASQSDAVQGDIGKMRVPFGLVGKITVELEHRVASIRVPGWSQRERTLSGAVDSAGYDVESIPE
jgi:hypothetical protein